MPGPQAAPKGLRFRPWPGKSSRWMGGSVCSKNVKCMGGLCRLWEHNHGSFFQERLSQLDYGVWWRGWRKGEMGRT